MLESCNSKLTCNECLQLFPPLLFYKKKKKKQKTKNKQTHPTVLLSCFENPTQFDKAIIYLKIWGVRAVPTKMDSRTYYSRVIVFVSQLQYFMQVMYSSTWRFASEVMWRKRKTNQYPTPTDKEIFEPIVRVLPHALHTHFRIN